MTVLLTIIAEHYHFNFTVSVHFANSESGNHWAILNKDERAYPLVYFNLCFWFDETDHPSWTRRGVCSQSPVWTPFPQNTALHCLLKYLKNSGGNLQARYSLEIMKIISKGEDLDSILIHLVKEEFLFSSFSLQNWDGTTFTPVVHSFCLR